MPDNRGFGSVLGVRLLYKPGILEVPGLIDRLGVRQVLAVVVLSLACFVWVGEARWVGVLAPASLLR